MSPQVVRNSAGRTSGEARVLPSSGNPEAEPTEAARCRL